jgi:hypothetical protein
MEGLAGQDDFRTFNYSHPEYYSKGQEYLAADINAVVDGLFAGGATRVEIIDAHGSGNPSPDLVPAKLDKRATQFTRGRGCAGYIRRCCSSWDARQNRQQGVCLAHGHDWNGPVDERSVDHRK